MQESDPARIISGTERSTPKKYFNFQYFKRGVSQQIWQC